MGWLSEAVSQVPSGERVVLWHGGTGRSLALSADTLAELDAATVADVPPAEGLTPTWARLSELHMLATSAPDLGTLIPARSRLVLCFPDEPCLWAPVPSHRTSGGYPWRALPLTPGEVALWRAFNGARTLAAAAAHARQSLADALSFLARLTPVTVQAVQLRDRPVGPREPSLARLVAPERPPHARQADAYGAGGETTLERWHAEDITDGATHFDNRETTVAHAFARPHPALHGLRFGEALHGALAAHELLPAHGPVLEVGPGTGELADAFLDATLAHGLPGGEYLRLDRSPELLATQAALRPDTRSLLGSATAIPLPDASVGLVLSNEVLADLSAAPFDPNDPAPTGAAAAVAARLDRYKIPPLPGVGPYNLGAWELVEEVARVLRPGGCAYLSEFGDLDEVPTETTHLDHPEVSIHFGHLLAVAEGLGLDAQLVRMDTLLRADLSACWLSRVSYEGLRARLRAEGRHLEARAWTAATAPLPWPVEGLRDVPVSQDGPAPVMTRFWALLVRRP